jgi:membrane fusion protein, copper/silver efflux system
MKSISYAILILALLMGSFLAGTWYQHRGTPKNNPFDISLKTTPAENENADQFLPGTVRVSPERQQTIGVRVGVVEKKPVTYTLRTLGRVALDETRIYRLYAAVDGWIRKVSPIATGSLVKKDDVLATFYAPEFLAAEQAYVYSLIALGRFQTGKRENLDQANPTNLNINQYIDALRNLGMGDRQIQELAETRKYTEDIDIVAPATGFIITRNISPGQRFGKGTEWFRMADQSQVWIFTDTYENEAQYLKPGMAVKIIHPTLQKTLTGKVSPIQPQFDPVTRTLKVRLEAANPGYLLKPDMFVDVEIPVKLPDTIVIPSDAILDTGLKKTVFIDRGNGYFEPREVETGWRLGNRVEITRGLSPGEKIAISGTFLIDSESRMELAAAGITGSLSRDPVTGAEVSVRKAEKAGRKRSFKGKTYYFASEENRARFDQDPGRYVDKSVEPPSGPPADTPTRPTR